MMVTVRKWPERHLRHRVELETLLRRRIEALLIPVVGFGNLSVEVTAEMDFTRRDIREERVDPPKATRCAASSLAKA